VALCNPPNADRSSFSKLQGALRVCNRSALCTDWTQYARTGDLKWHWGYGAMFWGGCLDHSECDVPVAGVPNKPPALRFPGISPSFRVFSRQFRHLVYKDIFRFSAETEALAKHHETLFGPPHSAPYVGVHLRGMDKFSEAVDVGIEPYVEQALRLSRLTGTHAVYLASDDYNRSMTFRSIFEEKAPSSMNLHMKPEEAYVPVPHNRVVGDALAILMAEISLLRDAAAFVGTASSNIGRLVYLLRAPSEGDVLDVSVDEGNDFLSRHCA